MKKLWNKIDRVSRYGAGIIEWITLIAIAVVSYIFFTHQDILVTAGHSVEMLNGHITDFYSACKKTDGTYGANYLPTTFVIFAIWNIPMKLLGLLPEFIGDWCVSFIMWNKLLPTLAFALSAVVLFKLAVDRLGFDKRKATLTVFLFFTTPMAFFSQFLFCQYDIFTVLFMLIGMYVYFKKEPKTKDYLIFSFCFGIATTFKYFAALIYIVLLLLRQKKVLKVALYSIPAVIPMGAELLFYIIFDRKAFMKSVFGFSALDSAGGFGINIGGVVIQGLYFVLILIIAFSYFTKPKNFDEFISYGMFYSTGICFALFGLMVWYPQWLLFMVPFWVLSTVINKHYEIFFWIDALLGLVLEIYIVNVFVNATDQELFRFGILHDRLQYTLLSSTTMSDLFVYNDIHMLFTVISVIFFIGFIFKHPKFNFENISSALETGRFIVNVKFVSFSCLFIVVAFICLPHFMDKSDSLAQRFGGSDLKIVSINNKTFADQYMTLDAESVDQVNVVCDSTKSTGKKAKVVVTIYDSETGEVVAKGQKKEKDIVDGSHTYTKIKLDESFKPEKDKLYKFRFSTDSERKVAIFFEKNAKETASYYKIVKRDYSDSYAQYKGKALGKREIVMKVVGKRPVS